VTRSSGLRTYAGTGAVVGLLVALIFWAASEAALWANLDWSFMQWLILSRAILWPASIFWAISASSWTIWQTTLTMWAFAVVLNCTLYALLGALAWAIVALSRHYSLENLSQLMFVGIVATPFIAAAALVGYFFVGVYWCAHGYKVYCPP
jgi:hypothetical protein